MSLQEIMVSVGEAFRPSGTEICEAMQARRQITFGLTWKYTNIAGSAATTTAEGSSHQRRKGSVY